MFRPYYSVVSADGTISIPPDVQEALNAGPGDSLAWEIGEGLQVTLRKSKRLDLECFRSLTALLDEWDSPEDEQAFNDL